MKSGKLVLLLSVLAVALLMTGCSSDKDDAGTNSGGFVLKAPSMGGKTAPSGLTGAGTTNLQQSGNAAEVASGEDWGEEWFSKDNTWQQHSGSQDWWPASLPRTFSGEAAFEFESADVQDSVIWSWRSWNDQGGSGEEWLIVSDTGSGYFHWVEAEQDLDGSTGSVEYLPNIVDGGGGQYYDWYYWDWDTYGDGSFDIWYDGVVDFEVINQTIYVEMASFYLYFDADGSGYVAYFEFGEYDPTWEVYWDATGGDGEWFYYDDQGYEYTGDWDDATWDGWDDTYDDSWDDDWDDTDADYDEWGGYWGKIGSATKRMPVKLRQP